MFFPLIYWIVLPLIMAWLVVRWIKKAAPLIPAPDVRDLFDRGPIKPKWFRAARRDSKGLVSLGDFEKQMEAVEAAYAGKEKAQAAGEKAEFLVFNDKAELLEQIDSDAMSADGEQLKIIGTLKSCFREKFGTPRQPHLVPGATATLKIARQYQPEQSLVGLERFSRVWLLSYFHLNTNTRFSAKVHPPRLQGETIGLFASRSPHRPSPIGLSVARLVKIEGDTLHLSCIDLVDGTPILDVKPYIPESDSFPDASAGWTKDAPFPSLKVAFEPQALEDIAEAEKRLKTNNIRQLLTDILSQDLRNPRDLSQLKDGIELGFFLHDFDAHYVVREGVAVVLKLITGTTMHKKVRRASPKRVALGR